MLQRLRNRIVRERKCIQACHLICCAHGEGRTPPADSAPLDAPPGSVLKLPPQKVHYQQSKFLEVAPGMRPARPRQAAGPGVLRHVAWLPPNNGWVGGGGAGGGGEGVLLPPLRRAAAAAAGRLRPEEVCAPLLPRCSCPPSLPPPSCRMIWCDTPHRSTGWPADAAEYWVAQFLRGFLASFTGGRFGLGALHPPLGAACGHHNELAWGGDSRMYAQTQA